MSLQPLVGLISSLRHWAPKSQAKGIDRTFGSKAVDLAGLLRHNSAAINRPGEALSPLIRVLVGLVYYYYYYFS